MEPEYFPVTENLNSISFPIIKFYFNGVLSLTESYGIHKLSLQLDGLVYTWRSIWS